MAGIGHNKPFVSVNSLSPDDKKKMKRAIMELNDSMTRAAAERELQKETINTLFDELGVEKKVIRRMAKVYYKANFGDEVEENKNFEEFYDTIIKNTVP